MKTSIDQEKVDFAALLYKGDWHKMACYDNDTDNIIWHMTNCMNYIIMLSEDRLPTWHCPPDLELLDGDWNEYELLSLYKELTDTAVQRGYEPDAGMTTRVKAAFSPRRRYIRRR